MEKLKRFGPAIILMIVIFSLSSIHGRILTNAGLGEEPLHIKGHFLLFFLLCVSFYHATKSIYKSMLYSMVYAFLDEIHQMFVPLRNASWFDIVTDTVGILIAGLFLWKLLPILSKKLKSLPRK